MLLKKRLVTCLVVALTFGAVGASSASAEDDHVGSGEITVTADPPNGGSGGGSTSDPGTATPRMGSLGGEAPSPTDRTATYCDLLKIIIEMYEAVVADNLKLASDKNFELMRAWPKDDSKIKNANAIIMTFDILGYRAKLAAARLLYERECTQPNL